MIRKEFPDFILRQRELKFIDKFLLNMQEY